MRGMTNVRHSVTGAQQLACRTPRSPRRSSSREVPVTARTTSSTECVGLQSGEVRTIASESCPGSMRSPMRLGRCRQSADNLSPYRRVASSTRQSIRLLTGGLRVRFPRDPRKPPYAGASSVRPFFSTNSAGKKNAPPVASPPDSPSSSYPAAAQSDSPPA